MFRQLLALAPVLAGVFAIPQFVPQLRIVLTDEDVSGVSWTWAALTSVNNAAWCAYFVLSRYWTALIPGGAVMLVAGALAAQLAKRGPRRQPPESTKTARAGRTLVAGWSALLAIVDVVFGRAPLGAVLTGAFVLQVLRDPKLRPAPHHARQPRRDRQHAHADARREHRNGSR